MQALLNCHLVTNDNLITLACVLALASYTAIAWEKLYPLGRNQYQSFFLPIV